MKNLIPMTDFISERSLKDISEFTITEAFKDGAKVMNEIFSYAKFLKKPVDAEMFSTCGLFKYLKLIKETETHIVVLENKWEKSIPKFYKIEDLLGRGYSLALSDYAKKQILL